MTVKLPAIVVATLAAGCMADAGTGESRVASFESSQGELFVASWSLSSGTIETKIHEGDLMDSLATYIWRAEDSVTIQYRDLGFESQGSLGQPASLNDANEMAILLYQKQMEMLSPKAERSDAQAGRCGECTRYVGGLSGNEGTLKCVTKDSNGGCVQWDCNTACSF